MILVNSGLKLNDSRLQFEDSRIKLAITQDDAGVPHSRIGRLKNIAASLCDGEILLELDCDDILTHDCLEEIQKAYENPKVNFAYGNTVGFLPDFKPNFYSEKWGWINRPFEYKGRQLVESVAWPPGAQSFRRIEWAPNHPRSFRNTAYQAIGGYDQKLLSGDDHDLCCRCYIAWGEEGCYHIDKPLYLQRVYGSTSVKFNQEVQRQTGINYLKYIFPLVERWADDHSLRKIDLGGAINHKLGYDIADLNGNPPVDLEKPWPWKDNSVGVFLAHHIVEHLSSSIHFFEESYRCLAPGGWLMLEFPSALSKGAYRDLSHKSFLVDQSLRYITNKDYARFINFKGRFQASRIEEWDMEPDVKIVTSELIALKPGYDRPAGECLI